MRNHIALKFLAVFLAALSLLGALGSLVGICGLVETDLYNRSVEELIEEEQFSLRQELAVHLVHQYASLEIGKVPASAFYDQWGSSWLYENFQYGSYFYEILNEKNQVVESTLEDLSDTALEYTHVVTALSFRHVLALTAPGTGETHAVEAPAEETMIPETTFPDTGDTQPDAAIPAADPAETKTTDPAAQTEAPTQAADAPEAARAQEPELALAKEDIRKDGYYDPELQQWVEFTYYYDTLLPYTVRLYLLPGAMTIEPMWDILSQLWSYRYALFHVLGFSLLLFAVCAVYLCCAAGRKPGREEIKAGGLNCIPLDLYAGGVGLGLMMSLFSISEGGEYLMRNQSELLLPFLFFVGYFFCLLFVGFCFACAAQFKTPGGYWYRHTLAGWGVRGLIWLWNNGLDLLTVFWGWLTPRLKALCRILGSRTLSLLRWLLGCAAALWQLAKKLLSLVWRQLTVVQKKCWALLNRFFSLLPLTWQWLLWGGVMVGILFFSFLTRSEGMLLLGLGLCLLLVLYGAHAFGILLESAKKMSQGDLETKVSDQMLLGAFREFAGDLNALADVAVVAAQKQLRSERMKTELITNVSHDIKTPLTSIINYVDLLQKPHTPEEGDAYLEVLARQSGQLKKLIEDLMEMSKASTGNMHVEIIALNAAETVNQALGEFADKLEQAKLTPVFRQPQEPIYMKADGRLAWRVLSNLLSNAVKYALPGTRLYIDLMEVDGKAVISLKNISREELNIGADELLERFVRGDASRNTEGSGLGLNIAQSLMELQKGQLQLLVDGDLFKVTLVFPAVKDEN